MSASKGRRLEYGGDWSIAKYIEAVETDDEQKIRDIMNDILKYNEEDLKATWAVSEWLIQFSGYGGKPQEGAK